MDHESTQQNIFSGNIFIVQAFDIGDDINLEQVRQSHKVIIRPAILSKYFKNYHIPLPIDLPHPHSSSRCISANIHNFGVISLVYKIPFENTLEHLRKQINSLDAEYQEQSVIDASSIFKSIKSYVKKPRFFHLRSSYVIIQVDPQQDALSVVQLKENYGSTIVSLLRFETEHLSEYQKDEILNTAIGYYRGDLFIIDTQAAFVYDEEYNDILGLFEFANIQQLELQYFDRILDHQMSTVYQHGVRSIPLTAYLPFVKTAPTEQITILNIMKIDISVIIERLHSSIKLAGEEYISELYTLLVEKLALHNWKKSIDDKLEIIEDMHEIYQDKVDTIREDILSLLVILLIFIELVVGILNYIK